MLSEGIPAWSKRHREQRDTFLHSIIDSEEQCRHASYQESVCSVDTSAESFYVMNPWLGGAFNVFETADNQDGGCDTDILRRGRAGGGADGELTAAFDVDSGSIDPSCDNEALCKDTRNTLMGLSQAPVCISRAGNRPGTATVPRSSLHNLCLRRPRANPTFCEHAQGMLHGMQGAPVRDLHRFVGLEPQGVRQGLFGNPLFAGIPSPGATQGR